MSEKIIRCRSSHTSNIGLYSAILFFPVIGVLAFLAHITLIVCVIQKLPSTIAESIVVFVGIITSIITALFMFLLSIRCYRFENQQICIKESGFSIIYPRSKQYAWRDIYEIGIITFASSASNQRYETQICIFMKPNDKDLLNKLHRSYLYGVFNLEHFILLDYDDSLRDILYNNSGLDPIDYRHYYRAE